ncbi:fluoride efflux transporter CrcB [Streptomyces sp. NPDC001068]|uniref:fluoride efflux transporter CrcB n=1 Tax=Streptomyces sp. NPDC001068 TaxID=3364544 RepID=UPI0036743BAD
MRFVIVALGGAVGAPLRYLIDRAVQRRLGTGFPWGTFAANITGSVILGVLTGATLAGSASQDVQLLLGTGFCGALTTYSTFSYDTLRLAEAGLRFLAVVNVVVSVLAGLGAVFVGLALAGTVTG